MHTTDPERSVTLATRSQRSGRQGPSATPGAGGLEVELALLARHQLRSRQHDEQMLLDRSGYHLLGRLEHGPLTLAQLAEAFSLDVSTVNRQMAALRTAGLVERVADPEGGAALLLRPTREGLRRLRSDRRAARAGIEKVLADWDDADVAALTDLLRRFNTSIEALEGRPWPRA
ncbi:MarR family winged helix-turn-helix transcriptional regulator [Nocardioides terrisoli]|uniref:MarR family winged helix-turn-helix transcriptional regulator n=1 Tax=Nocardioides terrisoli TaxID=3388267 RepID=UPI00287BA42C|nr:MarR family transcriptional regulator [Nocardioides marmorisolisilvae]